MSKLNISIIGNIVRANDPHISENGEYAIFNFCVAHNTKVKSKETQQYEEKTDYIDCCIFKKNTDSIDNFKKHLVPGMLVQLSSNKYPEARTYVNKENVTVATMRLTVSDIDFLSKVQS